MVAIEIKTLVLKSIKAEIKNNISPDPSYLLSISILELLNEV